jgi:hypothetical protein
VVEITSKMVFRLKRYFSMNSSCKDFEANGLKWYQRNNSYEKCFDIKKIYFYENKNQL